MVDKSSLERVINAYNEEDDNEYFYFHPKEQTVTDYPMSNAEKFIENIEDDKSKNKKDKPESLKKFLDYHTDDFFKEEFMFVEGDPSEYFEKKQKEMAEHISVAVMDHFKKFFAKNKNKVEESELRDEVKQVKKDVNKHYLRMYRQVEYLINKTIEEFNKDFKL